MDNKPFNLRGGIEVITVVVCVCVVVHWYNHHTIVIF